MGLEGKIVVCVEDDDEVRREFHDPRLIVRGPAETGDVWGLMRHDVATIVILDCGLPSVWHREIADAVRAGIRVVGAGRVGALRAAEMLGSGMEGSGRGFRLVVEGKVERDDELLDSSDGMALIDLRCVLDDAALCSETRNEILRSMAALHYRHRTRDALQKVLARFSIPEGLVPLDLPNVRHQDSREAILLALQSGIGGSCQVDPEEMYRNNRWQWLRTSIMYRSFVLPQGIARGFAMTKRIKELVGDHYFTTLSTEFFVLQWLKEHNLRCPNEWVDAYRRRQAHLFSDDGFLLENGLTRAGLAGLLCMAAIIEWAKANLKQLLPDLSSVGLGAYAHAWSLENGIAPSSGLTPAKWVVERGPCFFGFAWDYHSALLERLQLEGRAAEFARMCVSVGDNGCGEV